jgi:large subunit ribosomal protein L22
MVERRLSNTVMEFTHKTNNLAIAPRKLRLVADAMKHKDAALVLSLLALIPNKGAGLIRKSLLSAIDMVKQTSDTDLSTLIVHRIMCNTGRTYKRSIGHSRGRMAPIMKQHSHLSIVLTGDQAKRVKKAAPTPKLTQQKEEK